MGYQIVTWPMTSRDPRKCCEAVRSAILATAWLLVINRVTNITVSFCLPCMVCCIVFQLLLVSGSLINSTLLEETTSAQSLSTWDFSLHLSLSPMPYSEFKHQTSRIFVCFLTLPIPVVLVSWVSDWLIVTYVAR